jgi:aspartate-semialdehyde dehydrogenase
MRVAVLGATGAVGRTMLKVLEERAFPVSELVPLASERSAGTTVPFQGRDVHVRAVSEGAFENCDVALFSAGASRSLQWGPVAAAAGAVVIDNSSGWRMDPDVPLVVPEVNAHAIAGYKARGIIANPNCSTIQMVVALKPIHEAAGIKRVVVSTYQSTSGAGKEGMDELLNQTKSFFVNQTLDAKKFTKGIAFNVIPHIDVFMDDGSTKEEWKMVVETKKILDPKIKVHATCVRVPVFIGHAESVNLELERPLDEHEARRVLAAQPGVLVVDRRENGGYVTPQEVTGQDAVFVSRVRVDPTIDNGLSLWIVSDNLRKGAALNAVQIAEELIRGYI